MHRSVVDVRAYPCSPNVFVTIASVLICRVSPRFVYMKIARLSGICDSGPVAMPRWVSVRRVRDIGMVVVCPSIVVLRPVLTLHSFDVSKKCITKSELGQLDVATHELWTSDLLPASE